MTSYENWKSECPTLYAEEGCFGRWSSIGNDVILDGGYEMGYFSTGLEYMEVLSAGRRQPTWNDSVPEDGQATGSRCRVPTGNGSRLMRGIETFKWMTVRRGNSKCAQAGRFTLETLMVAFKINY